MISEGDCIILIDELGKRYSARANGGTLQTDFGTVDLSSVVGREPGTGVKSDQERELVVILEPFRKICFFGRSCYDM